MKTYMVETDFAGVIGYFKTLNSAQGFCKSLPLIETQITMMKGQRFGEGFHQYKMKHVDGKFKYTWKRK